MSEPDHRIKERKLAAILFADIQGFTGLMEHDESNASMLLAKFRNGLKKFVSEENGRIVNFYGDGCLAIFDNPVKATKAAVDVQSSFLQDPVVPVRIGLHSGSVVLEDDNVYGDSINQASRLESMALAGSILMSEAFRTQIKNQPDIDTSYLGSYEFKNVEEPVHIYALKREGLTIPQQNQISGKIKAKARPRRKFNWIIPSVFLLIAIAVLMLVMQNRNNQVVELEPATITSTPKDRLRNQRLAILVFENQTLNADLDIFGKMVSDWITKGLMETGEANIISALNIGERLYEAGVQSKMSIDSANALGIDVILDGRYYIHEDQLITQSNLVHVRTGQVIHAFDPIQGKREDPINLLEELTEEVMGYWIVSDRPRFHRRPPTYEAYQLYVQADATFATDFSRTSDLLVQSWQLDTTFLAPLLKLDALLFNNGYREQSDSLEAYLQSKKAIMTDWEKNRLDALIAHHELDWLRSARLNLQRYEMDSSDLNANYNAGLAYSFANYPQKAVEIWESFNDQYRSGIAELTWTPMVRADNLNRLGRYEEAINIVRNYKGIKMHAGAAAMEMRALLRIGRMQEFDDRRAFYEETGIWNGANKTAWDEAQVFFLNELALIDSVRLQHHFTQELITYYEKQNREGESIDSMRLAQAYYYLGNHPKSIEILGSMKTTPRATILLAINLACHGQKDKVLGLRSIIESTPVPEHQLGQKWYGIARIDASAGSYSPDAVQALELAIQYGKEFDGMEF